MNQETLQEKALSRNVDFLQWKPCPAFCLIGVLGCVYVREIGAKTRIMNVLIDSNQITQ